MAGENCLLEHRSPRSRGHFNVSLVLLIAPQRAVESGTMKKPPTAWRLGYPGANRPPAFVQFPTRDCRTPVGYGCQDLRQIRPPKTIVKERCWSGQARSLASRADQRHVRPAVMSASKSPEETPTAWRPLARLCQWRRPQNRMHPAKPEMGIRAAGSDEIWHRGARTNLNVSDRRKVRPSGWQDHACIP